MASNVTLRKRSNQEVYDKFTSLFKHNEMTQVLNEMGRDYMFFKQVPDQYQDFELRNMYRYNLIDEDDGIYILVKDFDYEDETINFVFLKMIGEILYNIYQANQQNTITSEEIKDRFKPENLISEIFQYWIDNTAPYMSRLNVENNTKNRVSINQQFEKAQEFEFTGDDDFYHNIVAAYLELNRIGIAQYSLKDGNIKLFKESDINNANFYIAFMNDVEQSKYVVFYTLDQLDNRKPVYYFAK